MKQAISDFTWIPFYTELANAIAKYSNREVALRQMIEKLANQTPLMRYLHFDRPDFWQARNNRIDPFTIMAIFNRATTAAHRTELAAKLASLFDIAVSPPAIFNGIAHLDPRNSIYNGPEAIWELFSLCLKSDKSLAFQKAWDKSIKSGNGLAMLSIALFWCNPIAYLPVDGISAPFIRKSAGIEPLPTHASGMEYVAYMDEAAEKLSGQSWPRLALNAWRSVHGKDKN